MKSANGVTGILIHDDDTLYFRVYTKNGHIDYDVVHSDLQVTISDEDAYFYLEDTSDPILDHSPETLGIKT